MEKATQLVHGTPKLAASHRTCHQMLKPRVDACCLSCHDDDQVVAPTTNQYQAGCCFSPFSHGMSIGSQVHDQQIVVSFESNSPSVPRHGWNQHQYKRKLHTSHALDARCLSFLTSQSTSHPPVCNRCNTPSETWMPWRLAIGSSVAPLRRAGTHCVPLRRCARLL